MIVIHILFAIISCWRLTEVITQDLIFDWIRKKFPFYLWGCPKCVSVWTGAICTILYFYFPFGNWPFALSWLYVIHFQIIMALESKTGKKVIISLDDNNDLKVRGKGIAGVEIPKIIHHLAEKLAAVK